LNKYSSPFVLDSNNSIAICGDWMNSSEHTTGPNIETAFMSGFKLANALTEDQLNDFGLNDIDCYQATTTHPIGDINPSKSNNIITGPPLNSIIAASSNRNNNSNNNNRNKRNSRNKNKTTFDKKIP
jgi:hypothetical protein